MTLTTQPTPQFDYFIGIDIAKKTFVAVSSNERKAKIFSNDLVGFEAFYTHYESILSQSFTTLEMTGFYELECAKYLTNKGFAVHRAHGYQIKNYIRSLGIKGKTDSSDAQALASYGKERHKKLMLFQGTTEIEDELRALLARRSELVKMRVQEKNRLQAPGNTLIKESFEKLIEHLTALIQKVEEEIDAIFKQNQELMQKAKIAESLPGIGKTISKVLIAGLPELGKVDGKVLSSLVGVAPHPKDSGDFSGYRSTGRGRVEIKKSLYIAALTASRSKSVLGDFYRSLVARGKKKMVALVALMRKMIVILNAKIRDFYKEQKTEII